MPHQVQLLGLGPADPTDITSLQQAKKSLAKQRWRKIHGNKNVNRFQQQPESFLNWQSKVKFFLAVLLREVVNSNVAFRTNKCVQI